MGASKRIILSQERILGKLLKSMGIGFGVMATILFVSDFKLIGFFVFFLIPALGLYFMGAYQDRKYKMLGRTPLELNASYCKKNQLTKAKIKINRNNFNKVQEIKLRCTQHSGDSQANRIIWENTVEPTIHFEKDLTLIEFDINIPQRLPESSSGFFSRQYSYEVSFKFTESMEFVERTWKIPVKTI
ncbi:hypothetical protein [Colwellia sp. BRX10-4]|jgi:hypothetical protein|uniref:hypothetical protein n=1 Tax=Colwellia sp. BRX10-4 TaxID=2759843 RepID=UPI0015F5AD8C|nr:hypothetical protein [Colwellia sp. BRX10-4]MBA6399927.1 hypothetical protein [Colwellia sp. BRX10-4]